MENFKSLMMWLAPPYSISVASIHIFGYWSTFDIDLFEYTTISDVVLMALIPALLVLVPTVFGLFTSVQVNTVKISSEEHAKRNRSDFYKGIILFLLMIPGCWFMDFYWLLLFGIIIPVMPFMAGLSIALNQHNRYVTGLISIFLVAVPLGTFISAKSKANTIIRGEQYWSATFDDSEYRFLGHAGEKTFFTNATNDKLIILPDTDSRVVLSKIKNSRNYEEKRNQIKELFN